MQKKGPLSHQKIIFGVCSTSNDWPSDPRNESWLKCKNRPPKSSKNEMLIFGLCATSDDRPSDLSNESWPKCKKRPAKSSKNEMLIFGLHSTSDDWPSDLSNESQPKCKKGSLSHQKMKCSFLDYIQLLMIGQVILVKKVDQNAKKAPKVIKKWNAHFWITFNFWWSAEWS